MADEKYVLITGATGNVGSFLIHKFLTSFYKVIVLLRPQNGITIEERVASIFLKHFFSEDEYALFKTNLFFLEANLTQADCGLKEADIFFIRDLIEQGNLKNIFNCAANVDFMADDNPTNKHQNLAIVENLTGILIRLNVCDKVIFNHVSTTYVLGTKKGHITESKIDEKDRNHLTPYDQSKFDSEVLIYKNFERYGLRYRIFRPSAIIGSRENGKFIKLNSLYIIFMQLKRIKTRVIHDILNTHSRSQNQDIINLKGDKYQSYYDTDSYLNLNFRFNYFTQVSFNLVPIDFITDCMFHISFNDESANLIFNLVSRNRVELIDFFNIFFKIEKVKGIEFIDPEVKHINDLNLLERNFKKFYDYSGFSIIARKSCPNFSLSNTIQFIKNSNIQIPHVDFDKLVSCYNYADKVMKWKN